MHRCPGSAPDQLNQTRRHWSVESPHLMCSRSQGWMLWPKWKQRDRSIGVKNRFDCVPHLRSRFSVPFKLRISPFILVFCEGLVDQLEVRPGQTKVPDDAVCRPSSRLFGIVGARKKKELLYLRESENWNLFCPSASEPHSLSSMSSRESRPAVRSCVFRSPFVSSLRCPLTCYCFLTLFLKLPYKESSVMLLEV